MDTKLYLESATTFFRKSKDLSERALAQVNDEAFFQSLDDNTNSIAVIIKHLAGNMRSRWRNFLTTDGEKPDRHRDKEFGLVPEDTRDSLMHRWEQGWSYLVETVGSLRPEDLDRTVLIRGEPHTVVAAISRELTHYAYHTGQIVLLAHHLTGDKWQSLSIPKGKSREFNAMMQTRVKKRPTDEA